MKGFEPLTAGATVRSSTTELHPPQSLDYNIRAIDDRGCWRSNGTQDHAENAGLRHLVHGTAATVVHAATGLSASGGRRGASMAVRRKGGQLLLQFCGVTLRAFGFLIAEDDGFKLVATLAAKIFENWHDHSQSTIEDAESTLRLQ